jgi:uncharacterized membrane protein
MKIKIVKIKRTWQIAITDKLSKKENKDSKDKTHQIVRSMKGE